MKSRLFTILLALTFCLEFCSCNTVEQDSDERVEKVAITLVSGDGKNGTQVVEVKLVNHHIYQLRQDTPLPGGVQMRQQLFPSILIIQ